MAWKILVANPISLANPGVCLGALDICAVSQCRVRIAMINRPPLPEDLEVIIESYDPQGRATYVSGYFEFKNLSLRFGAIMIEEYGGPNVAVTFPDETSSELKKIGLDFDALEDLITTIQRKIMEGAARVQLKEPPSSSAPTQPQDSPNAGTATK